MVPVHFLTDNRRLHGDHAAAAIIVTGDGRYLLQLRDDIPGIFYPGHWGCFGGAIGAGETPLEALRRELAEELEFTAPAGEEFVSFDFDLTRLGQGKKLRAYYEFVIDAEQIARFVLHEGAQMRAFAANELFALSNITPYDSFALWLHVARNRFAPEAAA
ncbi:MAG TPA: NUDIX domain-containing protein [Xanthobacteraceae bacterium]|nr:NUDIX domain-containing protein [Xanthobacteraceae bacterium]